MLSLRAPTYRLLAKRYTHHRTRNHIWDCVDDFKANSLLLQPANEVWGKVMFSQVCVSHSVHKEEGVSVWCHFLSGCPVPCSFWWSGQRPPPPGQRPLLDGDPPPPWQRPFLDRDPLYSKERAVHILLECILVTNCKGRICFHKGLSVHGGVGYLWSQVPSRWLVPCPFLGGRVSLVPGSFWE